MDIRETTKAHYDGHAACVVSLADRARGEAAPLKKFHNAVKRSLLQMFSGGAGSSLLDLATGRGGDLRKWMDIGIVRVKGLDISEAELHEARRRYAALAPRQLQCTFECTSHLGLSEWKDPSSSVMYDAVTCMFALHYFCGSEQSLALLLKTVAANLKVGGHFFGIVPDGKRINEHLLLRGLEASSFFKVTAQWTGAPRAFGSSYSFEIADTVTQGAPSEYLVYENVLCALAETVGLHPVIDVPIDGVCGMSTGLFKHLTPPYFGDARDVSRLYAAFVFKKM